MKSRRTSTETVPIEAPMVVRRKQKRFTKDQDKWLFPSATATVEVALPDELAAEIDAVVDVVYPALRDRSDFAYEACRYAIESWKEGISTPEGKALTALAQRKKRLLARKTNGNANPHRRKVRSHVDPVAQTRPLIRAGKSK
jgi:hypothetical protein